MNYIKKFSILLFFFSFSYLFAERIVYYKNPTKSLPIVITRNADTDYFDYTYYVLNEYKNPVFASKENPCEVEKDEVRERFFTSVEDYRRKHKIIVRWDYKDDKKDDQKGFLRDGTYELHLTETNKFQKGITREYVYYIVLDRISPDINAHLSQTAIKKNIKEMVSLQFGEKSKATSWQIFIDDVLLWKEDFPYGEERRFPIRYLSYEEYSHLPYGEHTVTIIAKDSALNSTEKNLKFKLVKDPFRFSIFSNKEVIFNKDGRIMPLYFTAIGDVSSDTWSCSIKDGDGKEHYSETIHLGKSSYCKGFSWNGLSQITKTKVNTGAYTVSISCSDAIGNSYTQTEQFIVSEGGYAGQDSTIPTPQIFNFNSSASQSLQYSFKDGAFHFAMKGYDGSVEGASLNIKKGEELVFKTDVENAKDIIWDGNNLNEEYILSTGDEYRAEVIFDDEEEASVFASDVKVPLILGELEENRRRVIVDSIYFAGYEVDVLKGEQYFTSNGKSLKNTAEAILKELGEDRTLVIVGNANYTTYPNATRMSLEDALLEDISLKRAQMIKLIFMFYGVSETKIKVEAQGGKNFIVPPNNKESWKNRRVEFFVEEK